MEFFNWLEFAIKCLSQSLVALKHFLFEKSSFENIVFHEWTLILTSILVEILRLEFRIVTAMYRVDWSPYDLFKSVVAIIAFY